MRNGFTESSGIHIVIEESKKSPSVLSNGISIQPGTETNIGLKLSTLSRGGGGDTDIAIGLQKFKV